MSDIQELTEAAENRSEADRRMFSWRTVSSGFLRSRRRDTRRVAEDEPLFTDWHHPWLFFLATGIMLFSAMDAFMTLQLLDRGAIEINPVMAAVIGKSTLTFAVTKMALTGVCVLALVYLSRSRFMNRMRTSLVLTIFFSFYAVLVCYEFVLLIQQL
ncbi:MAG: hypothetical protein DRQ63_09800 [Gammaproteobacteria bacterium]|nr:MAG: hypothetical protein DRQ63_09800 [Gammaproteobacteria bacterium]